MAIGSGSEGAQTTLEEEYKLDLSFEEAETLALSTLKQVMEEKVRGLLFAQKLVNDPVECFMTAHVKHATCLEEM